LKGSTTNCTGNSSTRRIVSGPAAMMDREVLDEGLELGRRPTVSCGTAAEFSQRYEQWPDQEDNRLEPAVPAVVAHLGWVGVPSDKSGSRAPHVVLTVKALGNGRRVAACGHWSGHALDARNGSVSTGGYTSG
jgi:hypothetical protein